MKISFTIIGYNESCFLKDCLNSIKDVAYEIVYVDCGSSDESVEVAKKINAKIFTRENNFNINVNKQFAIDNSSGDWVFYMDPDEKLSEELKKEIVSTLKNTDSCGFLIPRKNFYFGKWLRYGGKYPDKQLRLFKRGFARFECRSIHERIKVDGKVAELKNPFYHTVVRDTRHLVNKMKSYAEREGEEIKRLNKKQRDIGLRAIRRFIINYFLKLGFLDGVTGLFVAVIDLYNGLLFYFKSNELE